MWGLPGPVWCVFSQPTVAVYVSDDLIGFVSTLRQAEECGHIPDLLQGFAKTARSFWDYHAALAFRSGVACRCDRAMRGWLYALPPMHGLRSAPANAGAELAVRPRRCVQPPLPLRPAACLCGRRFAGIRGLRATAAERT
jgi:hypothetical protein